MVVLLSTTIITCSQALSLINRISSIVGLTDIQKREIVLEIKRIVPSCPVKIINKEK
jgi:hypothetical protein